MSEKTLRARKRRDPLSVFLRVIVWLAAIITVGVFVALVGYILIKGVPNLSLDLFQLKYTSDNCSMLPAIFNTIFMTLLSLVVAVPLGIFSAIYLTEYARRGNKLVKVVRLTTETLQGIPSIVYGLFGYLFFLVQLQWGYSLLAGAMTLAIMILPLIMRTTEEAVLSVPDGYREGSHPRHFGGRHTRHRPHRRRDGGADLHRRHLRPDRGQPVFPGAHAVGTHVCALQRGVAHRSGLRHGGGAADRGGRHQRPVGGCGQEHCKEERLTC